MSATSKQDISDWFDEGKKQGKAFMLVVCDTFDYDDYPVYAVSSAETIKKYGEYNGQNMQRVMEVYDLNADKQMQLAETRTMRLKGELT